jgi:hypothetical protein
MSVLPPVVHVLAAFVAGAIVMPALIFVALQLNLKGLATVMTGLRRDAGFYQAFALFGGALAASFVIAVPVVEASGFKEPWDQLVLIAVGMVPCIAMMCFIRARRLRDMPHD